MGEALTNWAYLHMIEDFLVILDAHMLTASDSQSSTKVTLGKPWSITMVPELVIFVVLNEFNVNQYISISRNHLI